ncbi:MAG: SDR family NAD(P)-dependent oxidoreductase [Deltaproteobacteria bacterium]|nr:SDR family NAD(P)-dependent oxidoreductase [Deltaproteobacteria bacterium]NND29846.1 SDR family NAD(P)-dependent oxidoreductase [Myxococcales bacterium]MBT8463430.1 SDR family NAD(P)-dependent oxidoreductase [Deltaproteobacteria bacterium]MBT8482207.1 SDR family NAD(P)-dependent oxidoreductase [Deltaproteobacteria bacterium]NNK09175.1 SDR family NAD(P)-dependent oxidoreductase [Myxococcales bacterium]
MLDFSGREAVVTGGTGALGSAVVGRLVSAGATVHVPVFESAELDRFAYRSEPSVKLHEGTDMRVEADVARLFAETRALYASIHIAGGFAMGPIGSIGLDVWDHLMGMNATTCFLSCRGAVEAMEGREGRIVNVAARPALIPTGQMTAYAASKAAVAALTLSLAEELSGSSIWVNAIVPSIIDTKTNRAAMPDADHSAWPKPEQIAETVAFLASPQNSVTRGALVPVYGKS